MSELDLTEAVEAAARALYEATRAEILADNPTIPSGGVPWEQAPHLVQHEWREGMLPVVAAAAPVIEAAVWNAAADFVDAQRDEDFGNDLRQVRDRLRSIARGADA